MALNTLQLSQVKDSHSRRYLIACAECFLGGAIGALGTLVILAWLI